MEKRKTGTSPLEIGADAGLQEMKKQDIVNTNEPAASPSLCEEQRTAMWKPEETMALLCSIFDVDLKNLKKQLELVVQNGSIVKVDFELVTPLCNIPRHLNNAHAAYDVFGLKDMKDIPKVLGDVMKPEARGSLLCFTTQFAPWYKAPTLE